MFYPAIGASKERACGQFLLLSCRRRTSGITAFDHTDVRVVPESCGSPWQQGTALGKKYKFFKKLNKPCIFPPEMLCTRDKVSGCS